MSDGLIIVTALAVTIAAVVLVPWYVAWTARRDAVRSFEQVSGRHLPRARWPKVREFL